MAHRIPVRPAGSRAGVALALVVSVALVAGCGGIGFQTSRQRIGSPPYTTGSGRVTSETRALGSFHAVSAAQGVRVFLSSGAQDSAVVSADDNLLVNVTTAVRDGTLVVGVSGSIETSNALEVWVKAASTVDSISASSGATLDAEDVEADALTVAASSGATVRGGGRAGSVALSVSSGSNADLRNVEALSASVAVSTGSTAHVKASQSATGACTSGSTLVLYGKPSTNGVRADSSSTVRTE